jgi:hypothetical protein
MEEERGTNSPTKLQKLNVVEVLIIINTLNQIEKRKFWTESIQIFPWRV